MGQKVNPVGMRIGVNKDWNSRWFAEDKEYNVFLNQDIKIRKYLEKEVKEASLSHIEIERTKTDKGYNVAVLIFVARVALVIGENGKNVTVTKGQDGVIITDNEGHEFTVKKFLIQVYFQIFVYVQHFHLFPYSKLVHFRLGIYSIF